MQSAQHAAPTYALIVSRSEQITTLLANTLQQVISEDGYFDSIRCVETLEAALPQNNAEALMPPPVLVIFTEFSLTETHQTLLESYHQQGSATLLLLSNEHVDALRYTTYPFVDDFCVYPSMANFLVYRIRLLMRQRILRLQERYACEALHTTQQRYQITANLVTNYLYCHHHYPDGRFIREWEGEDHFHALTGYTFAEMEAKGGWFALIHPDDLTYVRQHQERAKQEGTSRADFRVVSPNGKIIWLREFVRIEQQSASEILVYGGLQDITDLKDAQKSATIQMQMVDSLQSTALALSSTLDLDEVLDRILSNVETVIPYDLGDVMLIENGWSSIVRHRGYTERQIEAMIPQARFNIEKNIPLRMVKQTRKPHIVNDTHTDPGWEFIAPDMRWIRSYIGAPLYINDELIGVLNLNSQRLGYYTADDAGRLEVFATQVSAAIANARLHTQVLAQTKRLEQQYQEMNALYRATDALFDADNVEVLAYQITETIVTEFNQVDCGLMVLNDLKDTVIRIARSGSQRLETPKERAVTDKGLVPLCVRTGQPVYAPDVTLHPHYIANVPTTRSELVVPLYTHGGGIIGVLDLQSPELDAFNEQSRRIIKAYAERVSAAVENAILMERIRQYAADLEQRVQDRTYDLQLALERERELGDLKSQFITMVSHQFRTPLTAIQSAKELLQRYADRMTPEQRAERYNLIETAVEEMVRFLEDTLTINMLAEDKHTFHLNVVDLNVITGLIVEDFRNRANANYEISYHTDANERFALIDSQLWRRIVQEILLNATKFSQPHSTIRCELTTRSHQHLLTIQDGGMGIPSEDLERVFGTFDRGANVENISGAGLGLAIVKQTMQRLGGEVELTSELHHGTTVKLILPKFVQERV